jgi:hypothetical protein
VSNECLGIPVASDELLPFKDSVAKTFIAMNELTAETPNIYIVGKTAAKSADLSRRTGYSVRQTRSHCHSLLLLGLLAKKGERGGWMLTDKATNGTTRPINEATTRDG